MKNNILTINLDKAPKYMTPYEKEIIESLSSGEIILEILPVYDEDSISKRVYITVQNEERFSVQANLDADGNLFHGWIDQGWCSENLHPSIWNLIKTVLSITPEQLS